MENLYVDVRAQRGLQVKEVRDSPVHINKGDVKDVLDFAQICLLMFCFVSFFFSMKDTTNSVIEVGGAHDISTLNTQRTGLN